MKKFVSLLLLVLPLTLSSCLSSEGNTTNTNTSGGNNSSSPISASNSNSNDPSSKDSGSSSKDTSTSEEIEDDSKIERIYFNTRELEIQVSKTSNTIPLNYVYAPGVKEEDVDNSVTWKIEDESIATTDEYGRVTAKAVGKTTLVCTTNEGHRKAYIKIFTYPEGGSVTKKWLKIASDSALELGDQIIIACPEEGKVSGEDCTGMYLHPETATFSSDKSEITSAGLAAKFVYGDDYKGREGNTFEVPERKDGAFLATTNTGKVSFFDSPKSSQNLWDVDYDDSQSCRDIRSATNIDGWFMYSRNEAKFTTFKQSAGTTMFVVSLYKLTRV